MTPEQEKTAEKMTSVKAAWDKAPLGPRKDRALSHYRAAETAFEASDDEATNRELDAVRRVLS